MHAGSSDDDTSSPWRVFLFPVFILGYALSVLIKVKEPASVRDLVTRHPRELMWRNQPCTPENACVRGLNVVVKSPEIESRSLMSVI